MNEIPKDNAHVTGGLRDFLIQGQHAGSEDNIPIREEAIASFNEVSVRFSHVRGCKNVDLETKLKRVEVIFEGNPYFGGEPSYHTRADVLGFLECGECGASEPYDKEDLFVGVPENNIAGDSLMRFINERGTQNICEVRGLPGILVLIRVSIFGELFYHFYDQESQKLIVFDTKSGPREFLTFEVLDDELLRLQEARQKKE